LRNGDGHGGHHAVHLGVGDGATPGASREIGERGARARFAAARKIAGNDTRALRGAGERFGDESFGSLVLEVEVQG
jgi:hypothetical protein